jgi:hypothetical protein
VLTLALGIGANIAVLSLAEATLLRPLRVESPERLLAFTWSSSYPHYREFATHREVFAGVIATSTERRLSVAIDGVTELTEAAFISANTFGVLGVPAAAGRVFVASDESGPAALGMTIDRGALFAALALTLLTALLFGVLPAWRASRADQAIGGRDVRVTSSRSHVRGALVAAQVALSLVLMIGSGLFLQSLVHALHTPLGFDVNSVATASVNPGLARLDAARAQAFYA